MSFFKDIFSRQDRTEEIVITAPVAGDMMDITEVSDETFAAKILGDGIAVIPKDGHICAPCDGKIETIAETGHAFSITGPGGAEVLVHVGIDTVKMKGEGFTVLHKDGENVRQGEELISVDLDAVKTAGYDPVTILIVLNGDGFGGLTKAGGFVNTGDEVIRLIKNK